MGREQDLEILRSAAPSAPAQPTMEQLEVETTVDENAMPIRSNLKIFAVLTALYLSLFVAALDQTIVSTAIPAIASQLHPASGYTWIGGAYLPAKAAAMPIWAKLSNIWGRKPIILAALLIFLGSSIICALARTMSTLIAGRAVQGIGGGGLLQLTAIAISDMFSLRRRSLFLGLTELMEAGVGAELAGPDAAANVELIRTVKDAAQQLVVREAFAWSMRNMWIMYACVAGCGVVAPLFIERSALSKEHTETKTGIQKEEAQAVIAT